jgi:CDP-diacylglycerol--serine O-phosphatidyltransferase
VYVIPSLFTVANMLFGFLSVVASSRGQLERASLLIMVAIVADVLDGRIARMTGTTTRFGEAVDSLADVVSFGVAPAMLAYHWGLWQHPRAGMFLCFLFLAAGAIRLARFSTSPHSSRSFIGLPIPAAAAGIAMLVLMSPEPVSHPAFIPVVGGFVAALSLLMVSNLPYRSFKDLNLRRPWPAPTLFIVAVIVALAFIEPRRLSQALSILLVVYILSAPFAVLTGRLRRPASREEEHES